MTSIILTLVGIIALAFGLIFAVALILFYGTAFVITLGYITGQFILVGIAALFFKFFLL
jgi:hypothetical protein